MLRMVIDPALPDREALDNETLVCAVSMSGNCEPDGIRCSGGEHPLTCPVTCCFVSWLIGCKLVSAREFCFYETMPNT